MNCEEAENLMSARVDGEITRDDGTALDAHLAGCEGCRRRLQEMESQDAALLRAFAPRSEIALAIANRVAVSALAGENSRHIASRRVARHFPHAGRFAGLAAAAAVGFVAAILFVKPDHMWPIFGRPAAPAASLFQPVARLTFATGEVFTCPANQKAWREVAPHDPIDLGASVRTADTSKCELELPDGSCVRLNSGTEARFTADRTIQVSTGQLWSAVAHNAAPLRVSAGNTSVTAMNAPDAPSTRFGMTCVANSATVCVQNGSADVAADGSHTIVHAGEVLRAPSPTETFVCTAIPDPLLTARWQDDLLVLKPKNDPDLTVRVDQLLARISVDRQTSSVPGPTEQDIRAQGSAWCAPMACYIRNGPKGEARKTAAHLLADIAPATSVHDLIELLDDDEGEVRLQMALALRRLTGLTLGYSPEHQAANRDPAAIAAWREWWKQNKLRYPPSKSNSP